MNGEGIGKNSLEGVFNSDLAKISGWALPITSVGPKVLSELGFSTDPNAIDNRVCSLKLLEKTDENLVSKTDAYLMVPFKNQPSNVDINMPNKTDESLKSSKEESLLYDFKGLDYLSLVDELMIHQQVELFEVFTNWETKNRYIIKNNVGQQVYYTTEESDICARQCAGHQRSFTMHIFDNSGVEVARAIRQLRFLPSVCCCFTGCICNSFWEMNNSRDDTEPCHSEDEKGDKLGDKIRDSLVQTLIMEAPPGRCIGKVRQSPYFCKSEFDVLDGENKIVLRIKGKASVCQTFCSELSREFYIFTHDRSRKIGQLKKHWAGFMREMFTDADNFSITFPMDLHKNIKATLLGAVFLIDFNYFENNRFHNY